MLMILKSLNLRLFFLILYHFKTSKSQLLNHNSDLYDIFTPVYSYDISAADEISILIATLSFNNKYDCFTKCSQLKNCKMISYKITTCKLYSQIAYTASTFSSTLSNEPCLFQKFDTDFSTITPYLQNHWPFNNDFKDIVGGADIIFSSAASFTNDRLNTGLNAVYLNNGYLQVPTGIYFKSDFTFSVWIKPISITGDNRVMDFGSTSQGMDNVLFAYAGPYFTVCSNGASKAVSSPTGLKLNKWQHLAFSLLGSTGYLYVNGKLVNSNTGFTIPRAITRVNCYFGRSNYVGGTYLVNAIFDDIKIFNKSLTIDEINKVLNSYY